MSDPKTVNTAHLLHSLGYVAGVLDSVETRDLLVEQIKSGWLHRGYVKILHGHLDDILARSI